MFEYSIDHQDGAARAGRFHLPHGSVETPVFMPVGTQATVKWDPLESTCRHASLSIL